MVVLLGCCSGTEVPTPETDGLSRAQVADNSVIIPSPIVMGYSWRMPSTSVKEADART
jgi:hypothetical protein